LKIDTVTRDFVSDTEVFADVFNYYIYGGQQVIRPEQLMERDTAKVSLPYGSDGAAVPVQKFRDVQKLYAAMTDGRTEYVLYGVEDQSEINYAMAVKSGLYDMLEYARQVEEASKSHRRAMEQERKARQEGKAVTRGKRPDPGEFLGGFWKEDRLIPSVTLTIYFGSDVWDGPLSLLDMMETTDPQILSCMDDYHVRLIAPALMSDGEIMKLRSGLREVLLFIKYAKDKERLGMILEMEGTRFRTMERRAVDVIEAVTNIGLRFDEKEMKVDMCQAIREMRMESEQIGEARGEARGALKNAQENAQNFYRLGVALETIAKGVGYDLETVKGWLGL